MTEVGPRRLFLGGIRVDAFDQEQLMTALDEAILSEQKLLVFNHNLHSLYLYEKDKEFARAYRSASLVYIDGVPVLWLCRLAGLPVTPSHRITFLDCFESLLAQAADRGWRVFYLGSSEAVQQEGLAKLRERFAHLDIRGRNGFFEKEEASVKQVIREINEYRPDILFIGMGMPTQERWLEQYFPSLQAGVVMTSGATLDYVTGHAYRPPAWAGPLGLYGVMRLFSEPKRLWRRYLLEPLYLLPVLLPRLLKQRWGGKPAYRPSLGTKGPFRDFHDDVKEL